MVQKHDKASTTTDNLRNRLFGQQEPQTTSPGNSPGNSPAAPVQPREPRRPAPPRLDKAVAALGPTIQMTGDLTGKEDIVVMGKLQGSVTLHENNLLVDASGRLEGSIVAKEVLVRGETKGEINGLEKVTIAATGRVEGSISSPRVVLEEGCMFKGMVEMPFEVNDAEKRSKKPATVNPTNRSRAAAGKAASSN